MNFYDEGEILGDYDYQGEARPNESFVPVPAAKGLPFLKNKANLFVAKRFV